MVKLSLGCSLFLSVAKGVDGCAQPPMEKAKGILSTLGYKNLPSGEIIMAKEKKALLLGSSGALGTYLAPALVKMGYKVDVSPFPKQKIRPLKATGPSQKRH